MGLVGIAANVALAIGPAAGLFVVDRRGLGRLFAASTGMALDRARLALGQRETLAAPVRSRSPSAARSAGTPSTRAPSCSASSTTYGVQSTFLPLYAATRGSHAGVFLTVMACAIILSRGVGGGLSDRVGRAPVAAVGTACVTAAMGVVALGSGSGGLWSPASSTGSVSARRAGAHRVLRRSRAADRARQGHGDLLHRARAGIATGAIGAGLLVAATSDTTLSLRERGFALRLAACLGAIGRAAASAKDTGETASWRSSRWMGRLSETAHPAPPCAPGPPPPSQPSRPLPPSSDRRATPGRARDRPSHDRRQGGAPRRSAPLRGVAHRPAIAEGRSAARRVERATRSAPRTGTPRNRAHDARSTRSPRYSGSSSNLFTRRFPYKVPR